MFVRRKQGEPCPICGHHSWCTVRDDGTAVRCMRIESGQESPGSDGSLGWMHSMQEPVAVVHRDDPPRKTAMSSPEVTERAKEAFQHDRARYARQAVSEELGVSVQSLEDLRVGYGCDQDGRDWTSWPSRDGSGAIIGITRRYGDGSKKTMYRTRAGIFMPPWTQKGLVLVLEGGSDVAAALTAGISAIGRPSNTGGSVWISEALCGAKAVVVGENDQRPEDRGKIRTCPADCEGCGHCWPGRFGARVVADRLGAPWVMVPDGTKDFRDAYSQGRIWVELIRELGKEQK